MEVGRVGGGGGSLGTDNLDERVAAGRVPEGYGVAGEVDVVGKVVPDVGLPGDGPLGHTTDAPLEGVVGTDRLAVDPSEFLLNFSTCSYKAFSGNLPSQ